MTKENKLTKAKIRVEVVGDKTMLHRFLAMDVATQSSQLRKEMIFSNLYIRDICYTYAAFNKMLKEAYADSDVTYAEIFNFAADEADYINFKENVKNASVHHNDSFEALFNRYVEYVYNLLILSDKKFDAHRVSIRTLLEERLKEFPIDFGNLCEHPASSYFYRGLVHKLDGKKTRERGYEITIERCGSKYLRPFQASYHFEGDSKLVLEYNIQDGDGLKYIERATEKYKSLQFTFIKTTNDEIIKKYFLRGKERPFPIVK